MDVQESVTAANHPLGFAIARRRYEEAGWMLKVFGDSFTRPCLLTRRNEGYYSHIELTKHCRVLKLTLNPSAGHSFGVGSILTCDCSGRLSLVKSFILDKFRDIQPVNSFWGHSDVYLGCFRRNRAGQNVVECGSGQPLHVTHSVRISAESCFSSESHGSRPPQFLATIIPWLFRLFRDAPAAYSLGT